MLPRTHLERAALRGPGRAPGTFFREPRRWRGGGGGQAHRNAVLSEQVHYAVEPAEIEALFRGLQFRPAEDADAHHVHARRAHQPDVLAPDRLRPLLRIVVSAVEEFGWEGR